MSEADQKAVAAMRAQHAAPPAPVPMHGGPVFVVDIGHGKYIGKDGKPLYDPGCVVRSKGGREVHEATLVEAVGHKVAAILSKKGVQVLLTRDRHTTLDDRFDARREVADGRQHLFVSLHADSVDASVTGMTVYHHTDAQPASQQLAARLGHGKTRGARLAVLDPEHVHSPAALVELGNMRNPNNLSYLMSEKGQNALAASIAESMVAQYRAMQAENPALPPVARAGQAAAAPVQVGRTGRQAVAALRQ